MPARPLFWLTICFMLGISADRLFGEGLPVQMHYFAFAALILIAAMAAALWYRRRVVEFAVSALLFAVFGVWASTASAPQFSRGLLPFLKSGQPGAYIAEVSASPEYYPDKIRIPLRLLWTITGDRLTPLSGGRAVEPSEKGPPKSRRLFSSRRPRALSGSSQAFSQLQKSGWFRLRALSSRKRSLCPVSSEGRTASDKTRARAGELIWLRCECHKRPNRTLPAKDAPLGTEIS